MRKYSNGPELRKKTKKLLKDRWLIALAACFIVFMLATLSFNVDMSFIPVEDAEQIENEMNRYLDQGDVMGALDYLIMDTSAGLVLVASLCAALISAVYSLFVGAPLEVGYYRFNLDLLSRRKKANLGSLLFGFKQRYWKSVGTKFLSSLFIGLNAGIGAFIVSFIIGLGTGFGGLIGAFLLMVAYIVAAFVIVRLIIMLLNYSMIGFLVVDRTDLSSRQILAESKRMMKGNRLRAFALILGFLGMIFLAVFAATLLSGGSYVVGLIVELIATIVVGAFAFVTMAAFYRELVRGGKSKIKLVNLIARD